MTHNFPILAPPEGSIALDRMIELYCEKDGLVRRGDAIFMPAAEGEKQGEFAFRAADYWQAICCDLKAARLAWAARPTPGFSDWCPMSGRMGSLYEIGDVDLGILHGPGKEVVYEARFQWINSAEGPSSASAAVMQEKKESRGRLRVDWSSAVHNVLVELITPQLPLGKMRLVKRIIEENIRQLEAQGKMDREGSDSSLTDFLTGAWLESAKIDPVDYARAYADLLKAIYAAAGQRRRQPGTTMKKPPL